MHIAFRTALLVCALVATASPVSAGISFSTLTTTLGSRPVGLAFGDFDNDGNVDVVLSNDGALHVLIGAGDGTFESPIPIAVPGIVNLGELGAGDVDGDGDVDIAYEGSNGGLNHVVGVMLNDGLGGFTGGGAHMPAANLTDPIVADLNNDGRGDVVTSGFVNFGIFRVYVMFGQADGSLTAPAAYGIDGAGGQIQAVDMDTDGDLDLMIGVWSGRITFLRNNGTGAFSSSTLDVPSGLSPLAAMADLNEDGIADLVASDTNGNKIFVYSATGVLTFGAPAAIASIARADQAIFADIDGDGHVDIVVHGDDNVAIAVHRGRGDGTFYPAVFFTVSTNSSIDFDTADVDGDGRIDFGLSNWASCTCLPGGFAIFLNRSTPPPVVNLSTDAADVEAGTGWYNIASSGTDGVRLSATASVTAPTHISSLVCKAGSTTLLSVGAGAAGSPVSGSFIISNGTKTIICTANDNTGTSASTTPQTYRVDQINPTIAASVAPATPDGAGGWYASTPTVTFTCTDSGSSALASCPGVQIVSDGAPNTVIAAVLDNAGNEASSETTVSVDTTAPAISASVSPAVPNGDNAWYITSPAVSFTCDDATSGVASCTSTSIVGDGVAQTVTGTATDVAGHTKSIVAGPVNVDLMPPVVTLTGVTAGAVYPPGSTPSPICSTTDAGSGVATQATLTIAGGPSAFTATCTGARDVAGHIAAPISVTYSVQQYTFGGFQRPLQNLPALNIERAGRTVPVKFIVFGPSGSVLMDLSAVAGVLVKPVACGTVSVDPAGAFPATGDLAVTSEGFHFNWRTPSTTGCFSLLASLSDGSVHAASIQLR